MTDIWEDARQAWWRSERGEYGHNDERKILSALACGRKLEEALKAYQVANRQHNDSEAELYERAALALDSEKKEE